MALTRHCDPEAPKKHLKGDRKRLFPSFPILPSLPILVPLIPMSDNAIAFGSVKLNEYSDRQDFLDWLEVLEFLGFLQAVIFYAPPTDEPNPCRGGLSIVVGATIQVWRRAIVDAFGGPVSVIPQRPHLLNSILLLRPAMASMNLIARSTAGAMALAKKQHFNSDMGAEEPSIVAHGPHCLVMELPPWVVIPDNAYGYPKEWKKMLEYEFWTMSSMNSKFFDIPLYHHFREHVLPTLIAERPLEGEDLLEYVRSI